MEEINQSFWSETDGDKIKIDPIALLEFLKRNGYCKVELPNLDHILVKVENNIVDKISYITINDFVKKYLLNIDKKNVLRALFKNNYLKRPFLVESLDSIKIHPLRGSSSEGHLFYRNGYVCITKEGHSIKDYSSLPGFIWRTQIIDRDFITVPYDKSEYVQFLHNISGQDEDRCNVSVP